MLPWPSHRKLNSWLQNPDNPEAAKLFHELNQAYECLLDPVRRLALDQKLRVKEAKKERYKAYDAKRKHMVEELEQRERAAVKRAKMDSEEEVRVMNETERIKAEGRRLREMKQAQVDQAQAKEQGRLFFVWRMHVQLSKNSTRHTGSTQMATQKISRTHNPECYRGFAFPIWARRHRLHCAVPE